MSISRTIQVSIFKCQTWWKMNHSIMDPSGLVVMMSLSCHCSMVALHELAAETFFGFHVKLSWLEDVRDSGVNFYVLLQLLQALFVNLEREAEQELVQAGHSGIVEYSSLEIALGVNHVHVFGCVWTCLKVLPLLVSTWIFSLMMEFPW